MPEKSLSTATLALVALGGNLPSSAGRPTATLRSALKDIVKAPGISILAVSRFWQTPAWPPGSGPDYINAAIAVRTSHGPITLLGILHDIETALGRLRDGGRWGARGIDLDLIAWGEAVLPDVATFRHWRDLPAQDQTRIAPETLILPHPRMQDRGFVLAPLAEVAPGWRHPQLDRTVAELLAALPPQALAGMKRLTA